MVRDVVSDAISFHLNDPRIEGFVSVTKVEMTSDLRNADVYLSIFGKNQTDQDKTFAAIMHAKSRIQYLLGDKLQSKFCPVLRIYKDEKFKKMLETLKLIDEASEQDRKRTLNHEAHE